MNTSAKLFVCLVALTMVSGIGTRAQEKPATMVPLKIDLVIARYQGQKLVSSMPYTLTVNANEGGNVRTSLRMGAEVPISSSTVGADGKPAGASYSYRSIGTNIDCSARSNVDGRYVLSLTLEESAVYGEGQTVQSKLVLSDRPAFRSFRTTNSLVLKSGETTEFTTATDRITAEIVKVTVKLTALN